ncbi:MAG TPA: NAD(P)H-dependent glycerol-3-phosphate dehydrogenase [Acidobacteriaceae bacterium]|jgi:glycerol-3-phosphate dehydrogenase (NAD(P)+)|nr:NAD(P)H-dependent glycerol-3-phosphate dehydrogenase [Acidobacteriaceae bacterium]
MSHIAIIGAGSWGTAIAMVLARRGGHTITLWSHTESVAASIANSRENRSYLPGIPVPENVHVTSNLQAALDQAEILVMVVPSEHLRATMHAMTPFLSSQQVIVNATKGLEDGTCLRMTQVIGDVLAKGSLSLPCCVLSGPSFAQEVASGSPTAITIASSLPELAARIREEFSGPSLRLYTNEDVVGVELGGALKNVIALASGVVTGLGLGHNSIAALITRGIAEMTRLAIPNGGKRETLAGLAGLGDLVLTCTGTLSRNRYVGMELGRGRRLDEILAGMRGKVAEGVRTTRAALGLAAKFNVEMPITEQVAAVLAEQLSPLEAMRELMSRPGRDE